MEDLFQIIIIVFFILSSIASSMRKKKKQDAKKQQKINYKPTPVQTKKNGKVAEKKQKSSSELLEEILGLKIDYPEPPPKEVPAFKPEKANDTWDPAADYEEINEDGVSDYKDKVSVKKTEFVQSKKKHKAFKKVKPVKKNIDKPTVADRLFAQQKNLKDYIIIQEILNKPKALRK